MEPIPVLAGICWRYGARTLERPKSDMSARMFGPMKIFDCKWLTSGSYYRRRLVFRYSLLSSHRERLALSASIVSQRLFRPSIGRVFSLKKTDVVGMLTSWTQFSVGFRCKYSITFPSFIQGETSPSAGCLDLSGFPLKPKNGRTCGWRNCVQTDDSLLSLLCGLRFRAC
jgi:hypothetical protein